MYPLFNSSCRIKTPIPVLTAIKVSPADGYTTCIPHFPLISSIPNQQLAIINTASPSETSSLIVASNCMRGTTTYATNIKDQWEASVYALGVSPFTGLCCAVRCTHVIFMANQYHVSAGKCIWCCHPEFFGTRVGCHVSAVESWMGVVGGGVTVTCSCSAFIYALQVCSVNERPAATRRHRRVL